MYCKECGFQLSDDAKFCPNCGTKVELNGVGNIEQKAVFGEIEKDDESVDLKSINKQAQWSSLPNDLYNQQSKIICTKKTTEPRIFIKYFRYGNDTSELSPQWYVDEKQNILSQQYDAVSDIVDNDITFVKKNGKWACVECENLFFKEKTPFVFDKIITFRNKKKNSYCHFVNAQGTEKWGNWYNFFDGDKIAEVELHGKRMVLTSSMRLYGTQREDGFDIIFHIICELFIAAIVFGAAYGGTYLYDLITSNQLTNQFRLLFAGVMALVWFFTSFDLDDFKCGTRLVEYKIFADNNKTRL